MVYLKETCRVIFHEYLEKICKEAGLYKSEDFHTTVSGELLLNIEFSFMLYSNLNVREKLPNTRYTFYLLPEWHLKLLWNHIIFL